MTTTATFREYHADADEDAYLIANTDYVDYCRLSGVTDDAVRTAHLSRDQARDVGTFILRATGSYSSWADREWETNPAKLAVSVADGEATVQLGDADEGLFFILNTEDGWDVDLGQRLIAWAGVASVPVDA